MLPRLTTLLFSALILVGYIYPFSVETHDHWEQFCDFEFEPVEGAIIPDDQKEALNNLRQLNIAPPTDGLITAQFAIASCNNWKSFKRYMSPSYRKPLI